MLRIAENEVFNSAIFDMHDKIPVVMWNEMYNNLKNISHYHYRNIDKVESIIGYNLCFIENEGWNLWPINLNLKTGLYKIKTDKKLQVKGFNSFLNNNFIFIINGNIFEYQDKNNIESLVGMAKTIYFDITRLTIVKKMENEIFKSSSKIF